MLVKTILFFLFFIVNQISSSAQDTIRLKNGLVLHGLITEVSNKEIKFRVDGGSITLDQVLSYQKGGISVPVQNPIPSVSSSKPAVQAACEANNIGDMEFINKSDKGVIVHIYEIATPIVPGSGNTTDNPLAAQITIPPNSSKTAYELIARIHYIVYNFETEAGNGYYYGKNGTGQIRVTKCETGKFELK